MARGQEGQALMVGTVPPFFLFHLWEERRLAGDASLAVDPVPCVGCAGVSGHSYRDARRPYMCFLCGAAVLSSKDVLALPHPTADPATAPEEDYLRAVFAQVPATLHDCACDRVTIQCSRGQDSLTSQAGLLHVGGAADGSEDLPFPFLLRTVSQLNAALNSFDIIVRVSLTLAMNLSACSYLNADYTEALRRGDFLPAGFRDFDFLHVVASLCGATVLTPRADSFRLLSLTTWLMHHATHLASGGSVQLRLGTKGGALTTTYSPHASLAGALYVLSSAMREHGTPDAPGTRPRALALTCGDWSLSSIHHEWPLAIARELASFCWPIDSVPELTRLLQCPHADIRDLAGGEFTGAAREANSLAHGCVTLSDDTRNSLVPGVHTTLDLRLVLPLLPRWRRVYLFPPCTHQTLSSSTFRSDKELDGRMFWGIAFFIFCWCACADSLMVEQPDTVIPDYYLRPSQRIHTSEVGDEDDKTVNLYERGRNPLERRHPPRGGSAGHKRLREFRTADERDRWRSSWTRFPNLVRAIVRAEAHSSTPDRLEGQPIYLEQMELFASAWWDAGLPVPSDYLNPDAQPTDHASRLYQPARGRGDGRRIEGTVPHSRRRVHTSPNDEGGGLSLRDLTPLTSLTQAGIMLCFVVMQTIPLVYCALDGVSVLGAELEVQTTRPSAMRVAHRMSEAALGARSCAFLVGEYLGGARLFAVPTRYTPHRREIAHTPRALRLLRQAGCVAAWCTLAALGSGVVRDPMSRAVAACTALRAPTALLADGLEFGHPSLPSFRFGVYGVTPVVDLPLDLQTDPRGLESVLRMDFHNIGMLREALCCHEGECALDFTQWAERLRPPELCDAPPQLLASLPSFLDSRFDKVAYSMPYTAPMLAGLDRLPPQAPLLHGRCVRSAYELMPEATQRKLQRWMLRSLEDLVCIRDLGEDCPRDRPPVMTIGQSELHPWARGAVYDFRLSPGECAVLLDYHADLEHTLNSDFFTRELRDYPNQRLVSMIRHGVRYLADVELQGVFIPHLTSMPKGFASLVKEVTRLGASPLRWHSFHPHLPFWPIYFNGRGATPRKLEDRWRGTVEGGGPRKPTWDLSGLKVWSLNEASKTYHMPQHFLHDTRPEMLHWLSGRHLPPTPEMIAELEQPWRRKTKWERQQMPTLSMVMRDLTVLKRAAQLMGEPVYLLGDDVKDYFNHLPNAAEELWKHNIAWIAHPNDLEVSSDIRKGADELLFVSENRMGFGVHPNSGIAQELSEAINHILRARLDAIEDPLLEADPRPSAQAWLDQRRRLEERVGGHQRRLYSVHMFCDDNIIAVVGVQRTLRLLKEWRKLTTEAGLIMAIPEKRSLGTWCVWLGILVFASLGAVVVPKHKLLRASSAARQALEGTLPYTDYRSLLGLLEHIRQVICTPRRCMHGLYTPMAGRDNGQAGRGPAPRYPTPTQALQPVGPSDEVHCTDLMVTQLNAWLERLCSAAGAAVTNALRASDGTHQQVTSYFVGSSDAATDSSPPGLGGFLHGYYWYLPISTEMVRYLHITILELLATCFSSFIFQSLIPPDQRLTLQTDATLAYVTLVRERERSPIVIYTHHRVLAHHGVRQALARTDLGHLFGDANIASDLVSRALWDQLRQLSADMRMRLIELPVPQELLSILTDVHSFAVRSGALVRPPQIPPGPADPEPPLPPPVARTRLLTQMEMFLAGEQSTNENRDAVPDDREDETRPPAQHPVGLVLLSVAATGMPTGPMRILPMDPPPPLRQEMTTRPLTPLELRAAGILASSRGQIDIDRWARTRTIGLVSHFSCRFQGCAFASTLGSRMQEHSLSAHVGWWGYPRLPPCVHNVAPMTDQGEGQDAHSAVCVVCSRTLTAQELRVRGGDRLLPPNARMRGLCWTCRTPRGPPRLRLYTPVELFLSGGQTTNENRDAVSRLAALLAEKPKGGGSKRAMPDGPTLEPLPGGQRVEQAPPPTGGKANVPAPKRMRQVVIGGEAYAAPSGRRVRPPTSRTRALHEYAAERAMDMSGDSATRAQVDSLTEAIRAEQDLADFGAAYTTLDKDDRAWRYWEAFCGLHAWNPFISAELASRHADHVIQRLALFQSWVYPQLVGRSKDMDDAKPSTVFDGYVLAVHRILCRAHIPMPRVKLLEQSTHGLKRSYKAIYTTLKSMRHHKQPMLPNMWKRVEALEEGARLAARRQRWSPATRHRDRTLLRLGRVLWRTGHRLGEIVDHPSGEVAYLTRSCVSLRLKGTYIVDPQPHHWRLLSLGDEVLLAPCSSKCDQFGERWCPFPSVLPFDSENSAAASIRDIELESPCLGSDRETMPLFAEEDGSTFTYSILSRELHNLLASLFGESVASTLSWHSIRIGLACALSSAGCPDEHIQLICRWASLASLDVYRQLSISSNVHWTTLAFEAVFDAARVNNLPALGNDSHYAEMARETNGGARDPPSTPTRGGEAGGVATPRPAAAIRGQASFDLGAGPVQAYTDGDDLRAIGLTVRVPNDFWGGCARYTTLSRETPNRRLLVTDCLVAGECVRIFLHPDGSRCKTYVITYDEEAYPIKAAALSGLLPSGH